MRKYTEIEEKEKIVIKKHKRHDLTVCDICGKTTPNDWKENCYDAHESEIWMKTGSNYPEGGFGEEIMIDICPDCFENKLIPWAKSFGGEPTVKEWDW